MEEEYRARGVQKAVKIAFNATLNVSYKLVPRAFPFFQNLTNLVPRVLWLFGQRAGASRDAGMMEKIYVFLIG